MTAQLTYAFQKNALILCACAFMENFLETHFDETYE